MPPESWKISHAGDIDMARTTEMRLIELMALSQDVDNVVEYLGKSGNFQFQSKRSDRKSVV